MPLTFKSRPLELEEQHFRAINAKQPTFVVPNEMKVIKQMEGNVGLGLQRFLGAVESLESAVPKLHNSLRKKHSNGSQRWRDFRCQRFYFLEHDALGGLEKWNMLDKARLIIPFPAN